MEEKIIINIKKFDKNLLKYINILVSLLLMTMFTVTIIGVVFRYVINRPIMWTEEFSRYAMIYMVMVGSALAFREKKHPNIFFLKQKFSVKFLQKWNFSMDLIIIIILVIIFKEGYIMAVDEAIAKTPALRITFFWVYLAFPLGALLMISQIVANYIIKEKSFKIKDKKLLKKN